MEKYRAIPQGYMTTGEIAKKMDITVRTLQYYDRKGLLSPSAESDGGRRLYTDKDLITLHQIISLKSLGFSLEDIKQRLTSLDTPDDVANALAEQENAVRKKIEQLSASLTAIEKLRTEVLQMQTVDFKKYADIIVNLQMNNEYYFLIKEFDNVTLDHIRHHFDKETGLAFLEKFNLICDEIIQLKDDGVSAESDRCQEVTKKYWQLITEFTNGDMSLLSKLSEMGNFGNASNAYEEKLNAVNIYMQPALEIYFSKLGVDPFEGKDKNE